MTDQLLLISHARALFEQRLIPLRHLTQLYMDYNPIPNIETFVKRSQVLFPKLNCGLASLYLKHLLKEGAITQGTYAGHAHTFLVLKQKTIVDITADQYGGPSIYDGQLKHPWKLGKVL